MKTAFIFLLVLVALSGCDEWPVYPDDGTVFVVEVVPGERFRILLRDPARIEAARALLASGESTVVHGELARGSGRFNLSYGWHLRPSTVTFTDVAMELCDGRPSFVQQELEYFLTRVKYYCPWGSSIIAER